LGHGRVGVKVLGGFRHDTMSLNEETPLAAELHERHYYEAHKYLQEIRSLFNERKMKETENYSFDA